MSPEIATGVFTLGGLALGFSATTVRDAVRGHLATKREEKVAARLVHDELSTARGLVRAALQQLPTDGAVGTDATDKREIVRKGLAVLVEGKSIRDGAWIEHRAVLADRLTSKEWQTVANIYMPLTLMSNISAQSVLTPAQTFIESDDLEDALALLKLHGDF